MKIKTKLIQTKDYLLLIDEEAEIKEGKTFITKDNIIHSNYGYNYGDRVVIAYYPLTKEAKELDLPLLPNPFNKQIDEVTHLKDLGHECFIQMKKLNPSGGMKEFIRMAVEFGYKAAQSKQFSLEDMINAYDNGTNDGAAFEYACEDHDSLEIIAEAMKYAELDREEFIQSLSTQQLPKEFIPEYKKVHKKNSDGEDIGFPVHDSDELKTITNSEGKQELVGIYRY